MAGGKVGLSFILRTIIVHHRPLLWRHPQGGRPFRKAHWAAPLRFLAVPLRFRASPSHRQSATLRSPKSLAPLPRPLRQPPPLCPPTRGGLGTFLDERLSRPSADYGFPADLGALDVEPLTRPTSLI